MDFLEKIKNTVKDFWTQLKAKLPSGLGGKPTVAPLVSTVATKYEINLVPEVKKQMIKTLKTRNLVLFICIVVAAASVGVVIVLFGIKSGQDIAMSNQDRKLETMSAKLMGYEELDDLVTIQGQLKYLNDISKNKTMLSRVFGALNVMLPQGEDVVQLSDLRVDLEANTLRMEGQADAQVAPLIDYRVLESFKKGVALTKYDYGRFVDANGNEIPTWCIKEADADGKPYKSGDSYYAWWDLTADGCAALPVGQTYNDTGRVDLHYNEKAEVEEAEREYTLEDLRAIGVDVRVTGDGTIQVRDDSFTERQYDDRTVYVREEVVRVKVWRTPQFNEWTRAGYMDLDGNIEQIEHFVSACISYTGTQQGNTTRWISTNDDCLLAPDGLDVVSSSNARNESNNLVLKFTATVNVVPEFFAFRNKHMIAIGPMGQNVTDSYLQIGNMFTKAATECGENDTECLNNAANNGGTR